MRRAVLLLGCCVAAGLLLWAQRDRLGDRPAYEVKSLMPRETSLGQSAAHPTWRHGPW